MKLGPPGVIVGTRVTEARNVGVMVAGIGVRVGSLVDDGAGVNVKVSVHFGGKGCVLNTVTVGPPGVIDGVYVIDGV